MRILYKIFLFLSLFLNRAGGGPDSVFMENPSFFGLRETARWLHTGTMQRTVDVVDMINTIDSNPCIDWFIVQFIHPSVSLFNHGSQAIWYRLESALTPILLTWTIWRAPMNASKWRVGFNSAFKGLTLILLTWKIWRAPTNASKWRMGFNSAFKGLTLILLTWTIWRAPTNASKWRMGFHSVFKRLRNIS